MAAVRMERGHFVCRFKLWWEKRGKGQKRVQVGGVKGIVLLSFYLQRSLQVIEHNYGSCCSSSWNKFVTPLTKLFAKVQLWGACTVQWFLAHTTNLHFSIPLIGSRAGFWTESCSCSSFHRRMADDGERIGKLLGKARKKGETTEVMVGGSGSFFSATASPITSTEPLSPCDPSPCNIWRKKGVGNGLG